MRYEATGICQVRRYLGGSHPIGYSVTNSIPLPLAWERGYIASYS